MVSGAYTHAKLAGRVTDWQAGHHPGQAGPFQEKGRKEPQSQLGVGEGTPSPQPQEQDKLSGSSLGQEVIPARLPEPQDRPTSQRAPESPSPGPRPLAAALTSPPRPAADGVWLLLCRGSPLCPAGLGRSYPDKEFDSSSPVVRQAGREWWSRQQVGRASLGPGLPVGRLGSKDAPPQRPAQAKGAVAWQGQETQETEPERPRG